MEIEFYDRINKEIIKVEVTPQVAHQFVMTKKQKEIDRAKRKAAGVTFVSLDAMIDNGHQFASDFDIEKELERREFERKYLNSPEYKRFRNSLRQEIARAMDKMSKTEKQAMFLRFWKEMSIGQIAKTLNIAKGTAQDYLQRGCQKIKKFLEKDIKEQDELERDRKYLKRKKNFFEN